MQSESINELAEALAKAQAEMKDAALSKINPHFKNRYADLPAVRAAVTGPLSKNGLTAIQTMALVDGKSVLETTLAHKSGQWIKSVTPILVDKPGMQALGSGITYARRYALAAICGVASDEDDDGEASEGRGKNGEKNPPGITTFRQKSREFYRELYACTDYDSYVVFVNTPEVKAFMEEARTKFPKDWEGDGEDVNGIKKDMQIFCDGLKRTEGKAA